MADLRLDVPDDVIAAHEAQAAAKGVTLEEHFRDLFRRIADEVTDYELARPITDFEANKP